MNIDGPESVVGSSLSTAPGEAKKPALSNQKMPTEPGQTQFANSHGQNILKSIEFSKWFRESDANY